MINNSTCKTATAVCSTLLIILLIALGQLSVRPDWHEQFHVLLGHPSHLDDCESKNTPLPDQGDHPGCAIELYGSEGFQHTFVSIQPNRVIASIYELSFLPPTQPAVRRSLQEPPGRAPPGALL